MQRMVERQVRDLFVLTAEAISNNFTIETLEEITGDVIAPEMEEILQGGLRQYLIDVESDSTVRADLTRAKGEMSEFLNGTAQFFSTMAPVVQQSPQMAGPVVDLYSSFARQFNLGKQAEDAIEQMGVVAQQAATNPPPNPAAEAQKAQMEFEQQKAQAETQAKQAEMQIKAQAEMAKAKLEQAKLQLEQQKLLEDIQLKPAQLQQTCQLKGMDVEIKQAELQLKGIDRQIAEARLNFEKAKAVAEIEIEREQERAAKVGE